jgi:hypothetical protein
MMGEDETILHSTQEGYCFLMAAIIYRAIEDLRGYFEMHKSPGERSHAADDAMSFFHSQEFEAYCLALKIDGQSYREKAAQYYRENIPDLLIPQEPLAPRTMSAIVSGFGETANLSGTRPCFSVLPPFLFSHSEFHQLY